MRKEFAIWIEWLGLRDERLILLTGDLGFQALENVRESLGDRFLNMGVSEQNMVSVAAALAQQGLKPLCYSIAPFAVFRPYEQIRLDVAIHGFPVKIVGNGGGYGYGIMGATHHALEDLAVLSCLPNFLCVVPLCNSDVPEACAALFDHPGPAYLRLGFGAWPERGGPLPTFKPVRRIVAAGSSTPRLTIAGIGPALLNVLPWISDNGRTDVFAVSTIPLPSLDSDLAQSVAVSRQLLVIEEHSARGGLGEHLAAMLAREGIAFRLSHQHAAGYPDGLYGSQRFHQEKSGLDPVSLQTIVARLVS